MHLVGCIDYLSNHFNFKQFILSLNRMLLKTPHKLNQFIRQMLQKQILFAFSCLKIFQFIILMQFNQKQKYLLAIKKTYFLRSVNMRVSHLQTKFKYFVVLFNYIFNFSFPSGRLTYYLMEKRKQNGGCYKWMQMKIRDNMKSK